MGGAALDLAADAGIRLRTESPAARATLARAEGLAVAVSATGPLVPYERTLLWDATLRLRLELLAPGFALLDRWEVAVPLLSFDRLASHLGTDAERASTAAVIHDLRVPAYDPRLLFLRRGKAADRLLDAWDTEQAAGGDPHLAFLRALYISKPLVLALPPSWRGEK